MSGHEKLKVMKVANWLINQLLYNGEPEFTDRVLSSIGCGECFTEYEMQAITMADCSEED